MLTFNTVLKLWAENVGTTIKAYKLINGYWVVTDGTDTYSFKQKTVCGTDTNVIKACRWDAYN